MRITIKALKERIELVKALAADIGADTLTHNGYSFSDLAIAQENETVALVVVNGGRSYISSARGNKEVYYVLEGMIATLDAIGRFNN